MGEVVVRVGVAVWVPVWVRLGVGEGWGSTRVVPMEFMSVCLTWVPLLM